LKLISLLNLKSPSLAYLFPPHKESIIEWFGSEGTVRIIWNCLTQFTSAHYLSYVLAWTSWVWFWWFFEDGGMGLLLRVVLEINFS